MVWKTIERPGYFGKERDELQSVWEFTHGSGLWRLAWEFGDTYLEKIPALELVYTASYYEFFRKNPDKLAYLSTWKDVWDTRETNVYSGLDFRVQETPNNHYHDIAIRRAMAMHGTTFTGDETLHVRWKGSRGFEYNPAMVPFHRAELISKEPIKDYSKKGFWWEEGIDKSLEEWYQRNKVLQVRT
jgi:hypothetical protein